MDTNSLPPFEGPEKLLEVWFRPKSDEPHELETVKSGLRSVPRHKWEELLALVKCCVLNVLSNQWVDAYLLSESSMFLWNRKIILKTCGTTTLLRAVPLLLEIAQSCGLTEVENLFYSRKKFCYPEKQLYPHDSFDQEVKFLDSYFADGSSYSLGKTNGEHWYLYMIEGDSKSAQAPAPRLGGRDRTLEILMSGLDPKAMHPFYKSEEIATAKIATKVSRIGDLFPSAQFDDFLFDPLGYSVNALMDSHYLTIHVTPQAPCSYASFETNADLPSYGQLVKNVVDIFKPTNFTVTLFSNEVVSDFSASIEAFKIPGYTKQDKIFYQFDVYHLLFISQNLNNDDHS